jgi:hypothetical protein
MKPIYLTRDINEISTMICYALIEVLRTRRVIRPPAYDSVVIDCLFPVHMYVQPNEKLEISSKLEPINY